ncbi:hypothetical protein P7228_11630 [Altererythrobacter arenosus]|uniref:Tetratricopeptide repeat protein n=1 Tax=Altererythrobacter arenosus TaxID=3032592 RepID=A0ABY8FNQ4_9SPHN|nr:hypothetical protein [Altererythrobacter sp. CAU 1644]WFL76643.1 hypothetical protein P7228_11630 [Altererythrobacter sp. CAU 1644]
MDALGRPENFDPAIDSYPRVQVSRLRKNLESYYARNLPTNRLKVSIEEGSYRLTLIRAKQDQSESRTPSGQRPIASDADPPARSITSTIPILLSIAVVVASFIVGYFALKDLTGMGQGPSGPPAVELKVIEAPGWATSGGSTIGHELERIARIQLSNSFVSKPYQDRFVDDPADYVVTIDMGVGDSREPEIHLSMMNANSEVLFADRIAVDFSDLENARDDLEAALIYLTSPNGVIALDQLKKIGSRPANGYQCFVRVENMRTDGATAARLVEECLKKFPDSDYRSFWLARKSYGFYQAKAASGQSLEREGEGWSYLRQAIKIDEYNPFANFVAAKLELANDNCDAAIGFIRRAVERGSSYPTLVAALEADASSCLAPSEVRELQARLRPMVERNPSPDALLQLYLMVAAIAADDLPTAQVVASRASKNDASTQIEATNALLSEAIEDPAFAASNEESIRNALRPFVWSDRGLDAIIEVLLERGANA